MSTDPLLGQVIADRFRVDRLIGEGGMARVYVAEQLSMKRSVALKILRAELSFDPSAPARFTREVEAVTRLRSPHTIAFHDFGTTPSGQLYIAMELLEGETLRDRMERDGPLPAADVVDIIEQVAVSLAEAHEAGVIHRDLKPENVHLCLRPGDVRPFVKVLDFGLAKIHEPSGTGPPITAPLTTVGTPAYLAPEMAEANRVGTSRVDLYALGVMTFEMLTGDRPFHARSPTAMMMQHSREPIPSAHARRPGLPGGVDAFLSIALAKDPEDRLPDAPTFARALSAALGASA